MGHFMLSVLLQLQLPQHFTLIGLGGGPQSWTSHKFQGLLLLLVHWVIRGESLI